MFKSLILSWFWEGFKVTPDDFLGDEYIHFGHPSIPKNVACQDMQRCTKAGLREEQLVVHRTEPGVWDTCQVPSKCPRRPNRNSPGSLPLRVECPLCT